MALNGLEKAQFNSSVKRINSRIAELRKQGLNENTIDQIKHDAGLDRLPQTASGNISSKDAKFSEKQIENLKNIDINKDITVTEIKEEMNEKIPEDMQDNLDSLQDLFDKKNAIKNSINHFFDKYYETIKKNDYELFSDVRNANNYAEAIDTISNFQTEIGASENIKNTLKNFF